MKQLSPREKLYVGVFAVALIWGMWNFRGVFAGKPDTPQATPPPAAAVTPATVDQVRSEAPSRKVTSTRAVPEWSVDPFNRPWRGAPSPEVSVGLPHAVALELSAIVVRPDARFAVINGRIVRPGDIVDGRRVLRIDEKQVQVDDQGRKVILNL